MEPRDIIDIGGKLNPQQEKFCWLYATDYHKNGNGVRSYAEAYGIDISTQPWYATAQAASSRLLSNVIIRENIKAIMDYHITEEVVDHELSSLIMQDDDKWVKRAAIRDWNELRKRLKTNGDWTINVETLVIKLPE